jgi:methyltransferase (TIGR00027 family)
MDRLIPSRTALSTSLMRALHTRADPHPLINDPWGDKLVPESVRHQLDDEALRRSPAYENVVTRTRYAEDSLHAAVDRGVRQYVLIGAGFDSFVLRRPAFAANLDIFEIDHSATQGFKLERIKELRLKLAEPVHFIAADLSTESVAAALARSSFRSDQPAFFSWLGVTMYLSRAANLATLRSIARCAQTGSELVLTYVDEKLLDSNSAAFRALQERVTAMGEPFLSGYDPKTFAATLRECGLQLIEDLASDDVAERYGRLEHGNPGRSNFSHMALARVI